MNYLIEGVTCNSALMCSEESRHQVEFYPYLTYFKYDVKPNMLVILQPPRIGATK
jgi:hypothetical protein